MLVIGRNPVIETLKFSPDTIRKVIILESITDNKIKDIEKTAKLKNIEVEKLPKLKFEQILDKKDKSEGISQGIVAEVSEFEYSKTTEMLKSLNDKEQTTLVILDEIQDPHNFGAIIRTAVSAGADGIIISDKNSAKSEPYSNQNVIRSYELHQNIKRTQYL